MPAACIRGSTPSSSSAKRPLQPRNKRVDMAPSHYVDIHPHIVSTDEGRYPRSPLFGVQSDWSRERPVTIEQYVAQMDDAGIQQAAIVQASTCYGYDNSYLTDSIARCPGRLTAVGTVDLLQPDAKVKIREWI